VQVALRDDSDEPPSVEHREMPNVVFLHHAVSLRQRLVMPDRVRGLVMNCSMATSSMTQMSSKNGARSYLGVNVSVDANGAFVRRLEHTM
jgi:hypothetical protein